MKPIDLACQLSQSMYKCPTQEALDLFVKEKLRPRLGELGEFVTFLRYEYLAAKMIIKWKNDGFKFEDGLNVRGKKWFKKKGIQ